MCLFLFFLKGYWYLFIRWMISLSYNISYRFLVYCLFVFTNIFFFIKQRNIYKLFYKIRGILFICYTIVVRDGFLFQKY